MAIEKWPDQVNVANQPTMKFPEEVFSSQRFREQGAAVIELIANCMEESISGKPNKVIEMTDPKSAMREVQQWFDRCTVDDSKDVSKLFADIYQRTIRLHHPGYLGHQISPPLPDAALASLFSDFLNNGMGVFEMGIAGTAIERFVVKSLAKKMGFPESADGFLTSGGTLGNLTALLAARRAKAVGDVWEFGVHRKTALLVSAQAHYCVDRSARVMGWGAEGVVKVPVKQDFTMDVEQLELTLQTARAEGLEVIAVVGSACSTATGTFDDLEGIGAFCRQHGLWFHVDGAHGAASVYSKQYADRVKGLHLADSVVMDFHKLLMTPALATAVVFKEEKWAAKNFAQKAEYLWDDANHVDDWHDLAKRTFECTKSMIALKVFTILAVHGERVFDENVTTLYRSASEFGGILERAEDFELATLPQSNIVCFRFAPKGEHDLDLLNRKVREELLSTGEFYIVQTTLRGQVWLRTTIANPFTKISHFENLIDEIRRVGHRVFAD
ncbi:aminotransferase class I/II-fold pyridoxal phosphate-dependent enzyme [Mariniblastus sp.]|nr:aminotransferase class I/II-fold pyridoxal phosphate-dependent enzyme [Mariniblastus sp.]